MKLSHYAKLKGVTYRTAWNWWKWGILECDQDPNTGSIFVKTSAKYNKGSETVALYARVSSYEKKKDLESQLERLRSFAIARGLVIGKEIKEIASGMNDNRDKLNKILLDQKYGTILVENKDRLTRFGFNYIKNLLEMQGRKIIVMNETNDNQEKDLMQDFISVITSFCCRLYGLRKGQNKAKKIKQELQDVQDA